MVKTMRVLKTGFLFLLTFCFLPGFVSAQGGPGDYAATIKKQANAMNDALIKKDYKTYIKYMHPKVIEHMGGEKGVLDTMKSVDAHLAKYGISVAFISMDDPSAVIDTAGELQATISANAELDVKSGVVHANSVFVCISKDKGQHWVFIDVTTDYDFIKTKMKELSSKLVIPVPQKPTFDENN